jgi:hypothetical protein
MSFISPRIIQHPLLALNPVEASSPTGLAAGRAVLLRVTLIEQFV